MRRPEGWWDWQNCFWRTVHHNARWAAARRSSAWAQRQCLFVMACQSVSGPDSLFTLCLGLPPSLLTPTAARCDTSPCRSLVPCLLATSSCILRYFGNEPPRCCISPKACSSARVGWTSFYAHDSTTTTSVTRCLFAGLFVCLLWGRRPRYGTRWTHDGRAKMSIFLL